MIDKKEVGMNPVCAEKEDMKVEKSKVYFTSMKTSFSENLPQKLKG